MRDRLTPACFPSLVRGLSEPGEPGRTAPEIFNLGQNGRITFDPPGALQINTGYVNLPVVYLVFGHTFPHTRNSGMNPDRALPRFILASRFSGVHTLSLVLSNCDFPAHVFLSTTLGERIDLRWQVPLRLGCSVDRDPILAERELYCCMGQSVCPNQYV